jgi:hypothetical protein
MRSAIGRSRTRTIVAIFTPPFLHQVGLDYKKMEIPVFDRTFHLVEEDDGPIQAILA